MAEGRASDGELTRAMLAVRAKDREAANARVRLARAIEGFLGPGGLMLPGSRNPARHRWLGEGRACPHCGEPAERVASVLADADSSPASEEDPEVANEPEPQVRSSGLQFLMRCGMLPEENCVPSGVGRGFPILPRGRGRLVEKDEANL